MADFDPVAADGSATRKDVCLVCHDEEDEGWFFKMPCHEAHRMCGNCVRTAFYFAAQKQANYPPRCCGKAGPPLQLGDYLHLLPPALITKYKEKEVEYATRGKRTYCAKSNCSAFIPTPNQINDGTVARCHKCCLHTCTGCNVLITLDKPHTCSTDQDDAVLNQQARLQGWKRCWNCRGIVELKDACTHVTCACGTEFCYVCGTPWSAKPCSQGCPEYGEATYDDDGYATHGRKLHKDTGLDRAGFDFEGYNAEGFNRNGLTRDGLDVNGNSRTHEGDLPSIEIGQEGAGSRTHGDGGGQDLEEGQAALADAERAYDEILESLEGSDTTEDDADGVNENSEGHAFTVRLTRADLVARFGARAVDYWVIDSDSEDDISWWPAPER